MQGKRTQAGQVNTKQASITDFKIDTEGPTLNVYYEKEDRSAYTPGEWSLQNVVIEVIYRDDGCGLSGDPQFNNISVVKFKATGNNDIYYITTADGSYRSATVSCSDTLGNTTVVNLGRIMVDTTGPEISIIYYEKEDNTDYTIGTQSLQNVKFQVSCSDRGSGCPSTPEFSRY